MFTKVIWAVFLGAGALLAGQAHAAGPTTSTHYVTILPAPGEECTAMGQKCRDGSVYMYETADGSVVRAVDASLEVTRRWDSASCVDCGAGTTGTSPLNGHENTYEILWNFLDESKHEPGLAGAFEAAAYCSALTAHGKSDWFLPAHADMAAIVSLARAECIERTGSSNQCPTIGPYWSSTESNATQAKARMLTGGFNYVVVDGSKSASYRVRCVRTQAPE